MDTKETIAKLFPENESMNALVDELGLELKEKTLLECFEEVIKCMQRVDDNSFYSCDNLRFDERIITTKKVEINQIARAYGVTPLQALLLAAMTEVCKGDDIDRKHLSHDLGMTYIDFIKYDRDLETLQALKLVKRCRWGNLKVSQEVTDALAKNNAYRKPAVTGLTTAKILARISRLFNDISNDDADLLLALSEIDDMFQSNPRTSLSRIADKYGIIKTNDSYQVDEDEGYDNDYVNSMSRPERMLFYALLYRYYDKNDDDCGWWDFKACLTDDWSDDLQSDYKSENLVLQKKKVIEFANVDGMVVKDRFHINDEVKEQLLADVGGLHDRTPVAGLVLSNSIVKKDLFYDSAALGQVETMEKLLSEERFNQVKGALKDSGLRTGFTCLFYGSPGTGKTETVYQLARKTGRDIIAADVTKIKSCWVGESEKNIKSLFSRYRRCVKDSDVTPILLFNEADAIFGVRMEGAERAVDKMENSLQNIILQEMEGLDGILIATTNLTQNLDKAFERRFLYKVKFDVPSACVKSRIWKSMMPELETGWIDKLAAAYDFSGGQIENISRKMKVSAIINGTTATYEEIKEFCDEEIIGGPVRSGARIGF